MNGKLDKIHLELHNAAKEDNEALIFCVITGEEKTSVVISGSHDPKRDETINHLSHIANGLYGVLKAIHGGNLKKRDILEFMYTTTHAMMEANKAEKKNTKE